MVIKVTKFFILSLTTLGALSLFSPEGMARRPYYADEYFTDQFNVSLVSFAKQTNVMGASVFDCIKEKKQPSRNPNAFKSASELHAEATNFYAADPQRRGILLQTWAVVEGYERKVPQLQARKKILDGMVSIRTRTAFSNLIDNTIALIQDEGVKVRQLPYFKSGGSYTEDLTAYQMQVNCSIQGLKTVEDMLLSGQDNTVCRKVLEGYYPKEATSQKEAPSQEAPSRLNRWMTRLKSWI